MKNHLIVGAAVALVTSGFFADVVHADTASISSSVVSQHLEAIQLATGGPASALGNAYSVTLVSPVQVQFSSPYGGVAFQNMNILDTSFAHAMAASSSGGAAISRVYSGSNVLRNTD